MVVTIACPGARSEPPESFPVPVGREGAGDADFASRVDGVRLSERAALECVWAWFVRNWEDRDIPFCEVVAKVRALAPGTDVELIKSEFKRRLGRVWRSV
jgi:hypothetical protein